MSTDGAEFFSGVKQAHEEGCPEGMSVIEWKRLKEKQESQRYLDRGNSYVVRDQIEEHTELAGLFRSGDLVKGKDLADKLESEEAARLEFQRAAEDRQRDSRYDSPRPTTKDTTPQWHRERTPEE